MGMRLGVGQRINLLETGQSVTVSSEHSLLTKARLYDGKPYKAYRAAAIVADVTITVDGNGLVNGNLDSWSGAPVGWIEANSGTGDVIEEAVTVVSGKSAALAAGTGYALMAQTYIAKAGQKRRLQAQCRGNGASAATKFRLRNMATGKFLQSNGTWSTLATTLTGTTTDSYVLAFIEYTVESFALCKTDLVALQLEVFNDVAGTTTFVDDIADFPGIDCMSIHGHNLTAVAPASSAGLSVEFRSDTAAFAGAGTLRATATIDVPTFYALLGSVIYAQYWRVKIVGTAAAAVEIGELVIWQTVTPTQQYEVGIAETDTYNSIAGATGGGATLVHKTAKGKTRNRRFRYHYTGTSVATLETALAEARELFLDRPEGRTYPAVVIPDTDRAEVIFGRFLASISGSRELPTYYAAVDVELQEEPFASAAS